MIVALKNKSPVVVPPAALRRAGFKSGQELEVKAAGGVITIVPKLSPDELQDERERRDPKVRAVITKGYEEFRAGKTRPIEEFFAKRAARSRKRARPHITSGSRRNSGRATGTLKPPNAGRWPFFPLTRITGPGATT